MGSVLAIGTQRPHAQGLLQQARCAPWQVHLVPSYIQPANPGLLVSCHWPSCSGQRGCSPTCQADAQSCLEFLPFSLLHPYSWSSFPSSSSLPSAAMGRAAPAIHDLSLPPPQLLTQYRLFIKDFIYFFRKKVREGEREGKKHRLVASHMVGGTWPTTQVCALTGNQTCDLFSFQASTQSTEPHQPGLSTVSFALSTQLVLPLLSPTHFLKYFLKELRCCFVSVGVARETELIGYVCACVCKEVFFISIHFYF